MSNTQMTARELADRLGWDVEEDLALRPEAEVTILEDGTVNALEHGVLIADVARLSAEQMAKAREDLKP